MEIKANARRGVKNAAVARPSAPSANGFGTFTAADVCGVCGARAIRTGLDLRPLSVTRG